MRIKQSEEISELATAICKVQTQVGPIVDDELVETKKYSYTYSSHPNIYQAAMKAMNDNGIAVTQFLSGSDTIITAVIHTSGQYMMSESQLDGPDPKDYEYRSDYQSAWGSAITTQRRYAWLLALGLVTTENEALLKGGGNNGKPPANSNNNKQQGGGKGRQQKQPWMRLMDQIKEAYSDNWQDAASEIAKSASGGRTTMLKELNNTELKAAHKELNPDNGQS